MDRVGRSIPAQLVSFSGIDGAGKSTQIDALTEYLRSRGIKVTIVRFWDDVSRLKRIRESAGHTLFKGDKGVGTPEAPIVRKDKNVRSWPMTATRLFLYLMDALSARKAVKQALNFNSGFIIFDRYCYDEWANLNLHNPFLRTYVRILLKIVPRLNRSYLLDADPLQAHTRKPEYPLEFVYQNRAAYWDVFNLTGRMTAILPMNIEDAKQEIQRYPLETVSSCANVGRSLSASIDNTYEETEQLDGPYTHPVA